MRGDHPCPFSHPPDEDLFSLNSDLYRFLLGKGVSSHDGFGG